MRDLQEKLERTKNRIGLVGTRLNFSRPVEGRGIEEHITQDWKEIVIKIKQGLDLTPDEETKKYVRKVNADDTMNAVATDLLYHGCGHRELPTETGLGCPYNVENHDKILDGVARALKQKGKSGLESYVANAFEDILDNVNARRHTRHAGQIIFWNNEGLEAKGKKPVLSEAQLGPAKQVVSPGFTGFYEAFVKANLALWGNKNDVKLLKRFYSNSPQVDKAVREFLSYLKDSLQADELSQLQRNEELFPKLFDKEGWQEMAYRFAKATADLLEEQPHMRLCFGVPVDGVSTWDKLIKLPQTQEELAYKRYKAGVGPSTHTDPLLQLDALYRKISKAIPVKTSDYTKASGIPIVHFGRRNPKEDETVKANRIKGLGLNENGELTLKVARYEIEHPATYKVHPRNFPKLRIALLDTSGSMAESADGSSVGNTSFIPWGDNSKYHFALKGLYGIDNFLEKQGVAPYVMAEAITFSDRTRRTGKRQLRSEEERRALLRQPSGGTAIDAKALEAKANERRFLISVSDGDIANWPSAREDYRAAIERSDYCHIHLGDKNQFTVDLESWGIPVLYVRGDEDLSRLMIDATSKYYREGKFE